MVAEPSAKLKLTTVGPDSVPWPAGRVAVTVTVFAAFEAPSATVVWSRDKSMYLRSSSVMVTVNSAGRTAANPAGTATARRMTVSSSSATASSVAAIVTSAVADASPAGMVKSTLAAKAV